MMPARYIFYIFGGMFFFGLFAFSYATYYQFEIKISALSYLDDKLINQKRFLIEVEQNQANFDNSSRTSEAFIQNLYSYFDFTEAPRELQTDATFNRVAQRHENLQKQLTALLNTDNELSIDAIFHGIQATQKELINLKQKTIFSLKQQISNFIWICALILIFGGASLAIPFTIQHEKILLQAQKSNESLRLKAQELTATHTTMGNMLEDIVHERRQATRAAEINSRLAAIINSADDAILSLNLAGIIATANQTALTTFGDHIVGKRFTQLFAEETNEKLRTLIMATNEQKTGATFDLSLEKKTHRFELSLTLSPIYSDGEKLVGYSVIAKDITNAKLEEERFRLAVEAAPNAMIMINHHGFIVLVNSETENIFGYTRQELLGQSIHQLVPSNVRAQHTEYLKTFLSRPERRAMGKNVPGLNGQRKDGSRFPIEVGLTPINIDGDIYIISSIVDVSERLAQQYALTRLNEELSRKNFEMEQFIYAVSHDLKAPLITISGFAERLVAEPEIQSNDRHRHKIERIISNVKSMDSLIQDLLNLSRVIKKDLEKANINTSAMLNQVIGSLELSIKKANADIRLITPFYDIYAQDSLLYQCIQNILSNALKYRRPDVQPIITITPIREQDYTGLCIADNGIGIPAEHHKRIFNVFERLHPDICEGTGVGLAIVKTILDKHKGKILLHSEADKGSSFTLLFPSRKDKAVSYKNAIA